MQRRDRRGGEEESHAISRIHALTTGCVVATVVDAKAGGAATVKLPAQVCASGSGAREIVQQLLLECETETGGSSV